jgi:carboxylesterase
MEPRLEQARARLGAIAARERAFPQIDPRNCTSWWLRDTIAPAAVVLVHGFTNGPRQYAKLAPQIAARGHAAVVPRIRYHGYRDRFTGAISALRAEDWERDVLRAIAIAALCGERVVVVGISVGGTLCAWLATRTAIDHAIAVAPFCGIRSLPGSLNDAFGAFLRMMPNRFFWWDPRRGPGQLPLHAYPRFSTRALGESLVIAREIDTPPRAAHARRVTLLLNTADPIANNAYARTRFASVRRFEVELACTEITVPHAHDIIEPEIPQAQPQVVYPKLLELIEA